MKTSVILSTFNQPEWLKLTLYGYLFQADNDFQIVIADDGSGDKTREVIHEFQTTTPLSIKHVWHPDNGFQKCRILNRAIEAAESEYLILSDGDCVPRNDFIAVHKKQAEKGYFLSGGYFKLPLETSHLISEAIIAKGQCFDSTWLKANGVPKTHKLLKLAQNNILRAICNTVTPTKRTWNGHNASCWKSDAVKVNGFDERMRYGGEDVEFGYRLRHCGLKVKQIRYLAACVHLEHGRGYSNPEDLNTNLAIREFTLSNKSKITEHGIVTVE